MSETTVTVPLCTVEEGCPEPAIAQYVWPWGESGMCCARHQVILRQKSQQLKRDLQLIALRPGADQPVTRGERIQAQATILALQAEVDEGRQRGLELYRQTVELQSQVTTLRAQRAELEAQLGTARLDLEEARTRAGTLQQKLGQENAELLQLRALVPPAHPEEPAPTTER